MNSHEHRVNQILNAPKDSCYVWNSNDTTALGLLLHKLGRGDIRMVTLGSVYAPYRLYGLVKPVVIDHEARVTPAVRLFVSQLNRDLRELSVVPRCANVD